MRASVARSQQAFTATPQKPRPPNTPFHFYYSCSAQILLLLAFLLLRLWLLLLVSLAFQLLLGSLLMPTSPAIACFPAVAACLTATYTATNFPRTSEFFKTATFLKSGRYYRHLAPLALRAPVLNLRQITFSKKESFGLNIVVVLKNKFRKQCKNGKYCMCS